MHRISRVGNSFYRNTAIAMQRISDTSDLLFLTIPRLHRNVNRIPIKRHQAPALLGQRISRTCLEIFVCMLNWGYVEIAVNDNGKVIKCRNMLCHNPLLHPCPSIHTHAHNVFVCKLIYFNSVHLLNISLNLHN